MVIAQARRSLSGFEVYKTNDVIQTKELSSEDDSTESSDSEGFQLLNGEITQINYYSNMYKNGFDEDYEDISQNGNVSFPEVDQLIFYKGKKICLKKVWEDPNQPLTWDDLEIALLGFITEQSYSQDKVELKLAGMTKLLDKEEHFSFTQTRRSEILKQMIEKAGLKAKIDTTGLNDDVIDYTNVSSSNDDGGYTGDVSADIAEAAKQICQGKTSCLEKAKAIWKYCHDNMTYQNYPNSQKGAERAFKEKSGNCCDHANVVVQMLKSVNVKCAYEHSTTCYGTGHVWAVAYCEGTWYRIDAAVKSRSFNQVGNGCTGTRKETLGF